MDEDKADELVEKLDEGQVDEGQVDELVDEIMDEVESEAEAVKDDNGS